MDRIIKDNVDRALKAKEKQTQDMNMKLKD